MDPGQVGAEYDIQLWSVVPGAAAPWPGARTCTSPTQTALVGQVRDPAQLDSVLDRLQSVGLVLDDIHRVQTPSSATDGGATYEIRVRGEIGEALLGYLKWRHYVIPEHTLVRIVAGSAELVHCLKAYADAGATIEQVRKVLPVRHVECA